MKNMRTDAVICPDCEQTPLTITVMEAMGEQWQVLFCKSCEHEIVLCNRKTWDDLWKDSTKLGKVKEAMK